MEGSSPSPGERRRGGEGVKQQQQQCGEKVKPPDKKRFERDVGLLLKEIKEKEAQLKPLALAFSSSDISAEQASVAARLTEMEGQRSGNSSKLRHVEGDIKQRGIDVTHKRDAANKLIAGVRFKSEEKIDDTVGKLEQQLLTRQFSGSEERKLQHEIDSLRLSKESLRAYLAMKEDIEQLRNDQDALRKERDELYRANRDLRDSELALKDRQKELKREVEDRGRQRRQANLVKTQLTQEIGMLYAQRRQLYEAFKEQQATWMDATRKDREEEELQSRQREEDRRAVREVSRRRRQVLALEMQKELLYEDEKSTCRALISHMQKLSLAGEGSYSPATTRAAAAASDPAPLQHSTSPSLPRSSTGEELLAQQPGQFLRRRRNEAEEEVLVRSTSRRRSRKDRKRTSPASKVQKRLNHNAAIFSQFSVLSLPAPPTTAEIPHTLAQLQEKLAFYESFKRADSDARADSEAGDSGVGSTGYIDVLGSLDDIHLNSDNTTSSSSSHLNTVSPRRSLTDDSGISSTRVPPSPQSSVDDSSGGATELPLSCRPVAITVTPSPPNSTTEVVA